MRAGIPNGMGRSLSEGYGILQSLPGAGFSGSCGGGAAGRREDSITLPAYTVRLATFLGHGLAKAKGSQVCQGSF